jgi:hypothetical protein
VAAGAGAVFADSGDVCSGGMLSFYYERSELKNLAVVSSYS